MFILAPKGLIIGAGIVGVIVLYIVAAEARVKAWKASIAKEPLNEYANRYLPDVADEGWKYDHPNFINGPITVCYHLRSISVGGNKMQLTMREAYKLGLFTDGLMAAVQHRAHVKAMEAIDNLKKNGNETK